MLDLLKRVGDADQARRVPGAPPAAEREGAIVVAAARAETHAARIEAHQRQEHEIEPPGAIVRSPCGSSIPSRLVRWPSTELRRTASCARGAADRCAADRSASRGGARARSAARYRALRAAMHTSATREPGRRCRADRRWRATSFARVRASRCGERLVAARAPAALRRAGALRRRRRATRRGIREASPACAGANRCSRTRATSGTSCGR